MRIMIKPDTKNLAIVGCDNNTRLNSLIKNAGWIYTSYSGYNVKYRNNYPYLYSGSWIEVPHPLLFRLKGIDLPNLEWDEDAYHLFNESFLNHAKIVDIKKMNMNIINSIIRDNGLDPSTFKRTLKDHQLQALAMYLVCGSAANFGEVRTGKTPPTTIYLWWLLSIGKIDCALWIVPNNTKYTLAKELTKDLPDYITSLTNIIEGNKANKTRLWNEDRLFYIAGYETVRADKLIVEKAFENKRIALTLDECHRVKNNDAQQTAVIKAIPRLYTIILSGTPVANKPQDVFEPVQQVAPELLAHTAEHFKKTYAWTDSYENVTSWKSRGFGANGDSSA